ncbi:MAG: 5-formyltetrahydrofolate cyclo-ligase [Nocardioides sp.]
MSPSQFDRRTGCRAAKLAMRDQLLSVRKRRSLAEVSAAGSAIAEHVLALGEVRRAGTVAAYVSIGAEPGTGRLIEALRDAGKHVLLPRVTRATDQFAGWDLDWAHYYGPTSLAPARFGLLEPLGPGLGVRAITVADVVLVPGLAVSPAGLRLGRGAGCYDRALTRVAADTMVGVLLYADEVGHEVPAESHDQPVQAVVTPEGVTRF